MGVACEFRFLWDWYNIGFAVFWYLVMVLGASGVLGLVVWMIGLWLLECVVVWFAALVFWPGGSWFLVWIFGSWFS